MGCTTKPTTIRIDDDLKREAVGILDSIGLSYNSYVALATRQLVNQRRIPFELVAASPVPNEETRRALVLAEAKELGLIPDDAIAFNSSDGLFDYLEAE